MSRRMWLWMGTGAFVITCALVGALATGAMQPFTGPLGDLLPPLLRRDSTWQAMEARAVWRVGMDPSFPPFEYLDADGRPVGYDVELAHRLAAEWGMDVEIVPVGFDSLLDALQAAKIDAIVSAYPYDARLTRDVAFSQPYFDAGLQLAVAPGATIAAPEDLNGKRVAIEWGSEGDMIGRQWQRAGIRLTLVPYETPQDAVAALIEGKAVDALLVDNVTLRQAEAAGAPITAAGVHVTSNPYVVVVPRQAFELLAKVNTGLNRLQEVSELAAIEQVWFSAPAQ